MPTDHIEHRLLVDVATRTLAAAKGHPVEREKVDELLDRIMAGDPGMTETGGLAVRRTAGIEDPKVVTETTVYVEVGGYGEYGTFHLADGTTSDPYGGRINLRCKLAGHPKLDDTCACGERDYEERMTDGDR